MPRRSLILRRYVPAATAAQAVCVVFICKAFTVPPLQGVAASLKFLQSTESRHAYTARLGAAQEPKTRRLSAGEGVGSQPAASGAGGKAEDKQKPASAGPGKVAAASGAGSGQAGEPTASAASGPPKGARDVASEAASGAKPSPPGSAKPSADDEKSGAQTAPASPPGKDADEKAEGNKAAAGSAEPKKGASGNDSPSVTNDNVPSKSGVTQAPSNGAAPSGTTAIRAPIGLTVAVPLCAYVIPNL